MQIYLYLWVGGCMWKQFFFFFFIFFTTQYQYYVHVRNMLKKFNYFWESLKKKKIELQKQLKHVVKFTTR